MRPVTSASPAASCAVSPPRPSDRLQAARSVARNLAQSAGYRRIATGNFVIDTYLNILGITTYLLMFKKSTVSHCWPETNIWSRRMPGFRNRSPTVRCRSSRGASRQLDYWICVITRCAETGRVPPANGVMVSAVELSAGLRTVSTELTTVVATRDNPTI
jgi:hypothetical protein